MCEDSSNRGDNPKEEFKTGKSIFPGPEAGQHEIRLIFRNTSDTPLEDVVILDSLTSNFEMVSSDVSSSKAEN